MVPRLDGLVGHRCRLVLRRERATEGVDEERALPGPGHAAHAGECAKRQSHGLAPQVVGAGPSDRQPSAWPPAQPRQPRAAIAAQPACGRRIGFGHLLGAALRDDLAAGDTRPRPEVDQVVGRPDQHRVVFDDDDGVATIPELEQRRDERFHLGGMEPARRLVQEQGEGGQATAQQAGQLDALGLAGRQRRRDTVEVQVAQPDLDQEVQPVEDRRAAGRLQAPFSIFCAASGGRVGQSLDGGGQA